MATDPIADGAESDDAANDVGATDRPPRRSAPDQGSRRRSDLGPFGDGFEAMSSLQRQGIAAASEVFERFGSIFDRLKGGATFDPAHFVDGPQADANGARFESPFSHVDREGRPAQADGAIVSELRATAARSLDMYTSVFQSTFEAYADLMENRMRARGIRIGADAADRASASGPSGGRASGSLWIHNDTPEPTGPLHLFATDGRSAAGGKLAADRIRLIPGMVDIPAQASAQVDIDVDLAGVQPSHFHSLVLVREIPDESLVLTISALAGEWSPPGGQRNHDTEAPR